MTEPSLYERLGGVSPSLPWLTISATRSCRTRSSAEIGEPCPPGVAHEQSGPAAGPQIHAHLWVCTLPAGRFNTQPRSRAARLWAWRRRIASSRSLQKSSTKSQLNSGERLTPSKCRAEKEEVLAAFAAHKDEVTEGYAE